MPALSTALPQLLINAVVGVLELAKAAFFARL